MIYNKKITTWLLSLLTLSAFLVSCEDDDTNDGTISDNSTRNIVEVAQRSTSLNSLVAALSQADGNLVQTLSGDGPFTVFAPNNTAFDNLGKQLGFADAAELLANVDNALLSAILTYHVVPGTNRASSLSDGASFTTVQGENITISLADGVQVQDKTELSSTSTAANVTAQDQNASNGVIHFVDKVLIPQALIDAASLDIRPNLPELVGDTEALSTLNSALAQAGLVDVVSGAGPLNVLAPTNDAFAQLLEDLGDDYTGLESFDNSVELQLLADILSYHVLPPATMGMGDDEMDVLQELAAGTVETATGATLDVAGAPGAFTITDSFGETANVGVEPISTTNGEANIIDKVLKPAAIQEFLDLLASDDLATTVGNVADLSILGEALAATQLDTLFIDVTNDTTVVNGFTYFNTATVFAPTNAAFTALFDALGPNYNGIGDFQTDAEIALLADILRYHVVVGTVTAADLAPGSVDTALEAASLEIIARGNAFVIGDATDDINAEILTADVTARNGVAHTIDKVLLPAVALAFIDSLE